MLNPRRLLRTRLIAVCLGATVLAPVAVSATEWQPISSERLVKLPSNVMKRALEHDFRQSPLASRLQSVDSRLGTTQQDLEQLQQTIEAAKGDDRVALRHQFLEQKSAYIDQMEVRQRLQREQLQTRLGVYQGVLEALKDDRQRAMDPVSQEVRDTQNAARERMERIAGRVDESLFEMAAQGKSRYAQAYDHNLQKVKQLKQAIRAHSMNRSSTDGDAVMSREAYIRQLMADAEADLALLNQQDEMLGYMARLVAMDAQALQIELTYGENESGAGDSDLAATKPARMVDFFTP